MCNYIVAESCREIAVEVPDSIEREVILPVPPARVWTALTRPDQLSAWFGTQATVDLRPGGELTLEPHPDGTRLRLVESGFASLPPELRGGSHERNTRGWQRELGELAQYLTVR